MIGEAFAQIVIISYILYTFWSIVGSMEGEIDQFQME